MKSTSANILLIVVFCCISIVILEILVRVAGLAPPSSLVINTENSLDSVLLNDNRRERVMKPNAAAQISSPHQEFSVQFRTNELGLRDEPFRNTTHERSQKILVAGNSFVEGWGVELKNSFIKVAQHELINKYDKDTFFINAGHSGYGAAQSYLAVIDLFDQIKPDVLVFVLTGTMSQGDQKFLSKAQFGNNGLATGLKAEVEVRNGEKRTGQNNSFWQTLSHYSDLTRLITTRIANTTAINQVIPGDVTTDLFAIYRTDEASVRKLYEKTLLYVDAMSAYAASQNVPFYLVHLPMPFQVTEYEWKEGKTAYRLNSVRSETADATIPNKELFLLEEKIAEEFCLDKKIKCFFSRDTLAENAKGKENDSAIYYDYDFHLNGRGHKVLGEWFAQQLDPLI